MDIPRSLPGFTYLILEKINLARNEERFYYLAWQPSLLDGGAVVRPGLTARTGVYGRRGSRQHVMAPAPFACPEPLGRPGSRWKPLGR